MDAPYMGRVRVTLQNALYSPPRVERRVGLTPARSARRRFIAAREANLAFRESIPLTGEVGSSFKVKSPEKLCSLVDTNAFYTFKYL